jgi:hypothetical protein
MSGRGLGQQSHSLERYVVTKAAIGAASAVPVTVMALNDNLYGTVVVVVLGAMALAAYWLRTRR